MICFKSQESVIAELNKLAKRDSHTICICGNKGLGKSFLSKYYADLLHITDYRSIEPTAQNIRDLIISTMNLSNPILICIENLDSGSNVSYGTLLKYLEEPKQNVYIIITVVNPYRIPDTILSRCALVSLQIPTSDDLINFAQQVDSDKYILYKNNPIWQIVNSFGDVNMVLSLSDQQINHILNVPITESDFSMPISDLGWKLGHYADNKPTPVELILRYIIFKTNSVFIKRYALTALDELNYHRLPGHIVIHKFLWDCKHLIQNKN